MTDDEYKTMRVPADKWEQAKAQKEAAGRTWGEQIVRDEESTDPDVATEQLKQIQARLDGLSERVANRTADQLASEFGGRP